MKGLSAIFTAITPQVIKNQKYKVKQHQLKALEIHKNNFSIEALKDLCRLVEKNKLLQYLRVNGINTLNDSELAQFCKSLSKNQAIKCLDLGPMTENQFVQICK